jgi:hypothetical protein
MCRLTFLVLRSLVYLGHIYEIFFPAKLSTSMVCLKLRKIQQKYQTGRHKIYFPADQWKMIQCTHTLAVPQASGLILSNMAAAATSLGQGWPALPLRPASCIPTGPVKPLPSLGAFWSLVLHCSHP